MTPRCRLQRRFKMTACTGAYKHFKSLLSYSAYQPYAILAILNPRCSLHRLSPIRAVAYSAYWKTCAVSDSIDWRSPLQAILNSHRSLLRHGHRHVLVNGTISRDLRTSFFLSFNISRRLLIHLEYFLKQRRFSWDTYLVLHITEDTEFIRYRTYQILNLSDTYLPYQIPNLMATAWIQMSHFEWYWKSFITWRSISRMYWITSSLIFVNC